MSVATVESATARAESGVARGAALRVAMVTTFYPPLNFGGDGRYVRHLAHALARRGVEVEVIHDADAWRVLSSASDEPAPLPEPPGVTVHRLHSRFPLGATLLTHQTGLPIAHGRELRRLLERGFDVIHYHNVSLIGGPGVFALGDAIKFYTAHEHWLVCPTHVLWRHDRELCTGRQCVRCAVAYGRPPQPWRATGLLEREARHIDAFIALSDSVAQNHRAFGFVPPMKRMASFLPDGEPVGARVSDTAGRPSRPYFLFVGRLQVIKGLQDVIPRFTSGAVDAELWIAGSGNYEPELRRLADGHPSVRFLGYRTAEDLVALYRDAVALVAPSRCYEVFPMVALEAFCQSTPLVARNLGPFPQILAESGGGLLFDDDASLDAALRRLLADPAERDRMGARGREALRTRWSEVTAVNEYLALVQQTAMHRGDPALAARADALADLGRVATFRPTSGL